VSDSRLPVSEKFSAAVRRKDERTEGRKDGRNEGTKEAAAEAEAEAIALNHGKGIPSKSSKRIDAHSCTWVGQILT
jgi:hypothetical protein